MEFDENNQAILKRRKINIELSIDEVWTLLNNGKLETKEYNLKLK